MYIIQSAQSGVVISVYLASPFLRLNAKVEAISEKRFFSRFSFGDFASVSGKGLPGPSFQPALHGTNE